MTLFAGTTLIARIINRWRARQSMDALLRRMDDRYLDDIGVTRADLRRAFGDWRHERTGMFNAGGAIALPGGTAMSHRRAGGKRGVRVVLPSVLPRGLRAHLN
jgi:uncharacterized protein YjiS (DUF1127 family)